MKRLMMAAALVAGIGAQAAETEVLGVPGGRFVYGQVSTYHSDQFMLDTQTGRLWRVTCYDDPPTSAAVPCHDQRLRAVNYVTPELFAPGQDLFPIPLQLTPIPIPSINIPAARK